MKDQTKKKKRPFHLSIRNRSLSFTPLGTRFVVVCTLIGIAAINTGSNLLYLCTAMMLSMVIVSGILSEQALKRIRAVRRVPDEIYAGGPFAVRYSLNNGKRRIPSLALSVTGYGPGFEQAAGFVLRLPAGGTASAMAYGEAPPRGLWTTEGFELSTRFPFGLFRKSLRLPARDERLVFPAIRELPGGLPPSLTRGHGETSAGRPGRGSELMSLRDYRTSDDARLIHWKSSARLSRLMVKEFEAEHKKTVTVVLDDLPHAQAGGDYPARFEEAVSLAASAARELLLGSDVPVAFVSRGVSLSAGAGRGQYLSVMEALSLIRPYDPGAPGALPPDEWDRDLSRTILSGPYVLVLPARGSAWSGFAPHAEVVLEAGP